MLYILKYIQYLLTMELINYYRELVKTTNEINELRMLLGFQKSNLKKAICKNKLYLKRQNKKYLNNLMVKTNSSVKPISPKKVDFDKLENKRSKIKIIVQYYDEPNLARRAEIIKCFFNNINNKSVDELIVLIECNELTRTYEELKLDLLNSKKCKFIKTSYRLTYEQGINLAKHQNDKSSVYILLNNDCYFDETIDFLKKVDFNGSRILCLTRKDELEDGTIERAKSPPLQSDEYKWGVDFDIDRSSWPLLDYNCSDAWAFTDDLNEFNQDFELGTFNCEYYFTESAYLSGIDLRNPSEYINCIHLHNTNLRRRYALDNQTTSSRVNMLYPHDIHNPRTPDNWIVGTWRLRSKYNYIDKDQEYHEYTKYVVRDFNEICK